MSSEGAAILGRRWPGVDDAAAVRWSLGPRRINGVSCGTNAGFGCIILVVPAEEHGMLTNTEIEKPMVGTPSSERQDDAESVEIDDSELVNRAQREDLGAYDQLIRRYQERIYATV